MKKHKVLLNIINDFITFLLIYYTNPKALSFSVFTMPIRDTKIIPMALQKDVLPNQSLKKSLVKKIDKFSTILK